MPTRLLRPRLGRLAAFQRVEDRGGAVVVEVLVIIVVDLGHRCRRAIAHALDLGEREQTVGGGAALDQTLVLAGREHVVGATEHARRRPADLDMVATHGCEVEHRVEGRDLVDAHVRHADLARDELDHRDREPALASASRRRPAAGPDRAAGATRIARARWDSARGSRCAARGSRPTTRTRPSARGSPPRRGCGGRQPFDRLNCNARFKNIPAVATTAIQPARMRWQRRPSPIAAHHFPE